MAGGVVLILRQIPLCAQENNSTPKGASKPRALFNDMKSSIKYVLLFLVIAVATYHIRLYLAQNHSKNIAPANYSEIFIAEDLDPKVPVVITLTTCEACKASKIWLRKNKINYIELDIQKNERLAKRLLKVVNASAVPVLLTQQGAVVGFDPAQWKKSIKID